MPAEISTRRLLLRAWRPDTDLDVFFDIYSRWEVMRYLGSSPQVLTTRDEAADRLARRAAADPDGPPYGVWAICPVDDAERPVGSVLLRRLPWSESLDPQPAHRDVEVGWHLHPDVWGRGYATEAAIAMLDRAWSSGIDSVHAVTYPENAASQAVCRRIGMAYVERTDRYYDVDLDLFRAERTSSGRA
ncbi:MAG TPA: GNAT family N-acetyltransferase [Mycobacteriales bacterium]|nr:GNAT family N-acetyltransferase [Mycobacteriales bacterium]